MMHTHSDFAGFNVSIAGTKGRGTWAGPDEIYMSESCGSRVSFCCSSVTIVPTPTPEWDMNDNMKRLVNRARTLSKLRSNGEEDYEEEWAGIGRMVSAEAFEFGLHAGEDIQERIT